MYTTLSILKQTNACTGGFGRLLKFFGTSPLIKDQRIPLHVIALIGGVEDATWALENSLILDPAEFKQFYDRTLPTVWRIMCNLHLRTARYSQPTPRSASTSKKYDVAKLQAAYRTKAKKLTTPESITLFIRTLNHQSDGLVGGGDLQSILRSPIWDNPFSYIAFVISNLEYKISSPSRGVAATYAFDLFNNKTPRGVILAKLLKPEGTYDFMRNLKFRIPHNISITENSDDTVSVTLKVSKGDESVFTTLRNLQQHAPITDLCDIDQDKYERFIDWTVSETDTAQTLELNIPLVVASPVLDLEDTKSEDDTSDDDADDVEDDDTEDLEDDEDEAESEY